MASPLLMPVALGGRAAHPPARGGAAHNSRAAPGFGSGTALLRRHGSQHSSGVRASASLQEGAGAALEGIMAGAGSAIDAYNAQVTRVAQALGERVFGDTSLVGMGEALQGKAQKAAAGGMTLGSADVPGGVKDSVDLSGYSGVVEQLAAWKPKLDGRAYDVVLPEWREQLTSALGDGGIPGAVQQLATWKPKLDGRDYDIVLSEWRELVAQGDGEPYLATLKGALLEGMGGMGAGLQAFKEGITADAVAAEASKVLEGLQAVGEMPREDIAASLAATLTAAAGGDLAHSAGAWVAAAAVLLAFTLTRGEDSKKGLSTVYDPPAAERYFSRRPLKVAKRLSTMLARSAGFAISLYMDKQGGMLAKNEKRRAEELTDLLTFLGPTFIKIGQAISIRGDLLSPAYIEALRQLQDALPPFPTDEAKARIEEELGLAGKGGVSSVFKELSPAPIAAASLGQVYRGRLVTGEEVAVKVQRPGTLETITLDLMLVRWLAPRIRKAAGLNSDLEGLVDEWGSRFLEELDYEDEGKNATEFVAAMDRAGIDAVMAPRVFQEYTSRRVLTTAWVDGRRLDQSDEADVPRLCAVALNAYLTMLLDTGVLHADPHPGNLLRTPEGRLCILDWGLVTRIPKQKQDAILRYVGHLTSEQYDKIAGDLAAMGFIPAEKEAVVLQTPYLTEVLGKALAAIAKGGGVQNVKSNVELIGDELAAVGDKYGNLFQIPPYFAYILRTFSILEGIALMQNPNYTIVKECYPYIARRIFTDDSQVSREVLESLLFVGRGEERQLNVARLEKLLVALQSFEENAADPEVVLAYDSSSGTLDEGSKEALRVLLTPNGTYLQELLLDEVARSVDVLSRDALGQVARLVMSSGPLGAGVTATFALQRQATEALGALRPFLLPIPLPFEIVESATPVMELSNTDRATLENLERLWALLQPRLDEAQAPPVGSAEGAGAGGSPWDLLAQGQRVSAEVPEVVPGLQMLAEGLAQRLFERLSARMGGVAAALPSNLWGSAPPRDSLS